MCITSTMTKTNETSHNDSLKPKVAVITAIYGNYDNLKDPPVKNADQVDWYCFTDDPHMIHDIWNVQQTPYHMQFKEEYYRKITNFGHKNMMSAKFYKILSHKIDILKTYDYYIWTDASLKLQENFVDNITEFVRKDYSLINFKHSVRDNVKDEVAVSVTMGKYKIVNVQKQWDEYVKEKFPDNLGLFEKTMFVRKNNEKNNKLFDDWWEENEKYSFQDQVSYPYVLWKNNMKPDFVIEENVFNNEKYSVARDHIVFLTF